MGAQAESLEAESSKPPKRRLRNLLLDPRFQLKYTGMVVLVTVAVASGLGYVAYQYSEGQTESLSIQMAMQPELHPEVTKDLQAWSDARDRQVLFAIVGGIAILAVALGLTGIVVTHRLVGPAYKLRRLLGEVADGHLKVEGRLRRGDELQDVFEAFSRMLEAMQQERAEEIARLDEALEKAKEAGVPDETLQPVRDVRERLRASIE